MQINFLLVLIINWYLAMLRKKKKVKMQSAYKVTRIREKLFKVNLNEY